MPVARPVPLPTRRLGVLDVGSNTVHLLVVDGQRGSSPEPVKAVKHELKLAELMRDDGSLGPDGTARLVEAVGAAREEATLLGAEELLPLATSAVRDATDSAEVLAAVHEQTGVELSVLSGSDEARLTFLAVRRWFGWSAGRLLCLDIGGGSLELGVGDAEVPEVALSVPLGAGRLTRDRLPGDPPAGRDVDALRKHVRGVVEQVAPGLLEAGPPHLGVVTSKTFRSLARIGGAAPSGAGPLVPREVTRSSLAKTVDKLAGMTAEERCELPGVSASRARQLLAGAVVAHEALDVLDLDKVSVCPWALREGAVLQRLDRLDEGPV